MIDKIQEFARQISPNSIAIRRQLHQHPELAFRETQTAHTICNTLNHFGIPYQAGVAGTGIVGLIQGAQSGKTLLLRADMDALPIQEQTDIPFRSQTEGVMHACGHDVHTAILLGTAYVLNQLKPQLAGNIKLVFQPAEEDTGGAQPMIAAGVMENPQVDACAALHVMSDIPTGTVRVKAGAFMASPDEFDLTIRGRGGHGAHPEAAIDPIALAAQVITALQTLNARFTDPFDPKVISVCAINGGSFYNVIPNEVVLRGTVRVFSQPLREEIPRQIEKIAQGITQAFGGQIQLDYRLMFPPLINDKAMTTLAAASATKQLGESKVHWGTHPSMAGEDFAYFAEAVPSVFFHLGCAPNGATEAPPIHSPLFCPDESCIQAGICVMSQLAVDYLSQ